MSGRKASNPASAVTPGRRKLNHAPAGGIEPENLAVRCPRGVRHGRLD